MHRTYRELLVECKTQLLHIDDIKGREPLTTTKSLIAEIDRALTSSTTYPPEYVQLAKGNFLHKNGKIEQALVAKDAEGNEYFMVAKKDLY